MKALGVAGLLLFRVVLCVDWSDTAKKAIDDQKAENEALRKEVTRFGRQLMLQQFFTEERIRSEGGSGKQMTAETKFLGGLKGNIFPEFILHNLSVR